MALKPTESPYLDPAGYDADTAGHTRDIAFYRSLAGWGTNVLDLCCGTGRLTLPLKEVAGYVTGLDRSKEMLALARRKDPSIEWVQAEASAFDLGRRFDLIVCGFNSFQHFLKDSERSALLHAVRRHLSPAGVFAFDIWNDLPPSLRPYRSGPRQTLKAALKKAAGPFSKKPLNHFVVSREGKLCRMEWRRYGKGARSRSVLYRCYGSGELEGVLREAGFRTEGFWGGFRREPLGPASESLVVLAKPA